MTTTNNASSSTSCRAPPESSSTASSSSRSRDETGSGRASMDGDTTKTAAATTTTRRSNTTSTRRSYRASLVQTSKSLFQMATRRRRRRPRTESNTAAADTHDDDTTTTVLVVTEQTSPSFIDKKQVDTKQQLTKEEDETALVSYEHDADALVLPFGFLCGACSHGRPTMAPSHDLALNEDSSSNSSSNNSPERQRQDDPTIQESIECVFRSRHERSQSQSTITGTHGDHSLSTPSSSSRTSRLYRYNSHSRADVLQSQMTTTSSPLHNGNDTASNTMPQQQQYPLHAPSSSVRGRHDNLWLAWQKESQAWDYMHKATVPNHDNNEHPVAAAARTGSASPSQAIVGSLILDGTVPKPVSPPKAEQAEDEAITSSTAPSPQSEPLAEQLTCDGSLPRSLHDAKITWPQYPLLLRANAQTRVLGIRYSSASNYLWTPGSKRSWRQHLMEEWNKQESSHGGVDSTRAAERATMGANAEDVILPVNNGNEALGQSLVTDFETDLFRGTLVIRIRHTEGTTPETYDDSRGYFNGVNRRYQAVIRGRFKRALPWTDLLTGFHLDKPCGRLPPKFIVKSALKVISFFAPQLQAQVSGTNPHVLTPLGSTPQSITVHDASAIIDETDTTFNRSIGLIDDEMSEPTLDQHTLLHEASPHASSMHRARFRKKNFDRIYATRHEASHASKTVLMADPEKVYTFEFLQHLFDFEAFSIELGSVLGAIPLAPILHGQPLQVMACDSKINYLWGFELWHAELMDEVKKQASEVVP